MAKVEVVKALKIGDTLVGIGDEIKLTLAQGVEFQGILSNIRQEIIGTLQGDKIVNPKDTWIITIQDTEDEEKHTSMLVEDVVEGKVILPYSYNGLDKKAVQRLRDTVSSNPLVISRK